MVSTLWISPSFTHRLAGTFGQRMFVDNGPMGTAPGAASTFKHEENSVMASDAYEAGLAVRKQVLGSEYVDTSINNADNFTKKLQDFVTEHAWGTVWQDETIDKKTRSMINVALLAGLPRHEELRLHLRGALNNGVSKDEIASILLHIGVYAGAPCAVSGFKIAKEIFAEYDGGDD
jgi:4-carboxymuconolactone decarboxylase